MSTPIPEPSGCCQWCCGDGGWYASNNMSWHWIGCESCFGTGRADALDPDELTEHGLLRLLDKDQKQIAPTRGVGLILRYGQMHIDRDLVYDPEVFPKHPIIIAFWAVERENGEVVTMRFPCDVSIDNCSFTLSPGRY